MFVMRLETWIASTLLVLLWVGAVLTGLGGSGVASGPEWRHLEKSIIS